MSSTRPGRKMSAVSRIEHSALFADRADAGGSLAHALAPWSGEPLVVVGLARGGVVVAAVVARALAAPLDALAVRKVRHPLQPEYALGAVAPGAPAYVRGADGLSGDELAAAIGRARAEADDLDRRLRAARPRPSLAGRTVLLVDDGLATGATMIAAVRWARVLGAGRVVAAVPVGARKTVELLRGEADEVVCPHAVEELGAVGLWYREFSPVDERDVAALLGSGP